MLHSRETIPHRDLQAHVVSSGLGALQELYERQVFIPSRREKLILCRRDLGFDGLPVQLLGHRNPTYRVVLPTGRDIGHARCGSRLARPILASPDGDAAGAATGPAPGGAIHPKGRRHARRTHRLRFDVLRSRHTLARPRSSAQPAARDRGRGDRGIRPRLERGEGADAIDHGDASSVWPAPRHEEIPGYYATVRQDNREALGIVGERYRIVQNHEAFAFVDQLLGSSIHFETAGSLHGGRRVWVLATLPDHVEVGGETCAHTSC